MAPRPKQSNYRILEKTTKRHLRGSSGLDILFFSKKRNHQESIQFDNQQHPRQMGEINKQHQQKRIKHHDKEKKHHRKNRLQHGKRI